MVDMIIFAFACFLFPLFQWLFTSTRFFDADAAAASASAAVIVVQIFNQFLCYAHATKTRTSVTTARRHKIYKGAEISFVIVQH